MVFLSRLVMEMECVYLGAVMSDKYNKTVKNHLGKHRWVVKIPVKLLLTDPIPDLQCFYRYLDPTNIFTQNCSNLWRL